MAEYFLKKYQKLDYDDFIRNYDIELIDENYVKVIESASLTIVRPDTNEFEWDFGVTFDDAKDPNITYSLTFGKIEPLIS